MKTTITIFFLLTVACVYGQKTNIYLPNGEKYATDHRTLEQINKSFESRGRVHQFSPFAEQGDFKTTVGYHLFTDSALYVITENPSKIDEALKLFDLNAYTNTHNFKIELESFIEQKVLDRDYIQLTLGTPDHKSFYTTKLGQLERWRYSHLGIDLIVENDVVTHFMDSTAN